MLSIQGLRGILMKGRGRERENCTQVMEAQSSWPLLRRGLEESDTAPEPQGGELLKHPGLLPHPHRPAEKFLKLALKSTIFLMHQIYEIHENQSSGPEDDDEECEVECYSLKASLQCATDRACRTCARSVCTTPFL